jgi:ATP-binding cassette subfamily B protein
VTGVDADRNVVFFQEPCSSAAEVPFLVDELRLKWVWSGEAVLLPPERGTPDADAPFTLGWAAGLVLRERPSLRDIGLASLTLSFLTIFPRLLVMTVVDKVLTHRSYSTRPDTKLGLHVFNRLLRLRLDYFERDPPARRCIESPRSTRSASSSRAAELMSGNSPPGPRR